MAKPKIIIVDDKATFRNTLKNTLSMIGECEIIGEAENGVQYLQLLKTLTPDITFMDIEMPEMNGIVATREALKLKPNITIIGLSMYANKEYVDELIEAGSRGYLLKLSNNYEIIKQILANPRAEYFYSEKIAPKNAANAAVSALKTILIVDDFETNTIVISSALSTTRNFKVLTATSPDEALKIAYREQKIDIMVVDYNMPGKNGADLIRDIKNIQAHANSVILILSSDTDPVKRDDARAAGATGWIKKPFNLEKFLSIINSLAKK